MGYYKVRIGGQVMGGKHAVLAQLVMFCVDSVTLDEWLIFLKTFCEIELY